MSRLLTLDRLIINQKAKIIELTNQYLILDEEGAQVGTIQQEGQSTLRKVARFFTRVDQFLTIRLTVNDETGNKVLELTRPRKLVKSKVLVADASGRQVGEIRQENVFGKIRFDLTGPSGEPFGQIRAENWRAWNFAIVDTTDHEVGRITKKFEGITKFVFTTADNYLVEIDAALEGDRRLMVLAAAAAVDTALKQDDRGVSGNIPLGDWG